MNINLIKVVIRIFILTEFSLLFANNLYAQKTTIISVDPAHGSDIYEGIGAVSAGASTRLLIDYPEPMRSHILDYLFKPNFGAGYQHLKVEIGGDVNSTDGAEPSHMRKKGEENFERGYEWWLMKEAVKRNPDMILDCLIWGTPGWIGKGNFYSQDCIDYTISFLKGAKKFHHLNISYVGVWNERPHNNEWIKKLRKGLDSAGLQAVKIVAPDNNSDPLFGVADEMLNDVELRNAIDIIGVHYPFEKLYFEHPERQWPKSGNSLLMQERYGKRLWASENGEFNFIYSTQIDQNRLNSTNLAYLDLNITKSEFWSPITSYYDCLPMPNSGVVKANSPWSGSFRITPALWLVAHTTQFAKPGWKYIRNASTHLNGGGTLVSLTSPDKKDISIIAETMQGSEQVLKIKLPPEFDKEILHVWRSNIYADFVQLDDITPVNNEFTIKLAGNSNYSITTTTGQQKGMWSSPVSKSFPLPYKENFESYQLGSTAKYLSDMGGAFEVIKWNKQSCIQQQVLQRGIDWMPTLEAHAIMGDEYWNDIDVSANVSFVKLDKDSVNKQFAAVLARYSAPFFPNGSVSSYKLQLFGNGDWKLLIPYKTLAEGNVVLNKIDTWHNLRLICEGKQIKCIINGKVVAEITDSTFQKGLIGIASGFSPILFDNISVNNINIMK